jgi:hypothetical protein
VGARGRRVVPCMHDIDRLLREYKLLTLSLKDRADNVQGDSFAGAIADGAPKPERLTRVFQCFLLVSEKNWVAATSPSPRIGRP